MAVQMKSIFKCILWSLILLMLFMGAQQLVAYSVGYWMGPREIQNHMYALTLMSYGITLLGLMAINHYQHTTFRESYRGFSVEQLKLTLKYVIPLWLLVICINGILLPFFPTYDAEISTMFGANEGVLRFIVLVIGAPFLEEYIFREKLLNYVEKHFGATVAIVFQGLLFGLIHQFALQRVYASVLGIGLGFLKVKTKHILAPTLVHMFINCIGWLAGS